MDPIEVVRDCKECTSASPRSAGAFAPVRASEADFKYAPRSPPARDARVASLYAQLYACNATPPNREARAQPRLRAREAGEGRADVSGAMAPIAVRARLARARGGALDRATSPAARPLSRGALRLDAEATWAPRLVDEVAATARASAAGRSTCSPRCFNPDPRNNVAASAYHEDDPRAIFLPARWRRATATGFAGRRRRAPPAR